MGDGMDFICSKSTSRDGSTVSKLSAMGYSAKCP